MSLVSERDGFFGWRQADDPYSLEERGWVEDVGSTGSYYPLPRWLVYMCMGGLERADTRLDRWTVRKTLLLSFRPSSRRLGWRRSGQRASVL